VQRGSAGERRGVGISAEQAFDDLVVSVEHRRPQRRLGSGAGAPGIDARTGGK